MMKILNAVFFAKLAMAQLVRDAAFPLVERSARAPGCWTCEWPAWREWRRRRRQATGHPGVRLCRAQPAGHRHGRQRCAAHLGGRFADQPMAGHLLGRIGAWYEACALDLLGVRAAPSKACPCRTQCSATILTCRCCWRYACQPCLNGWRRAAGRQIDAAPTM